MQHAPRTHGHFHACPAQTVLSSSGYWACSWGSHHRAGRAPRATPGMKHERAQRTSHGPKRTAAPTRARNLSLASVSNSMAVRSSRNSEPQGHSTHARKLRLSNCNTLLHTRTHTVVYPYTCTHTMITTNTCTMSADLPLWKVRVCVHIASRTVGAHARQFPGPFHFYTYFLF